jgi:hypothetical protein
MPVTAIMQFLRLEAAGGIVLVGAAALAMILANSVFGGVYEEFLEIPVVIRWPCSSFWSDSRSSARSCRESCPPSRRRSCRGSQQ